jgi:apolipoprotein D and lipocalin family protein
MGYNVIAQEYKYALVAGALTIYGLSREKSIPLEVTSDYLKIAEDIGYKTADLIWVNILNKKVPELINRLYPESVLFFI